MTGRKRETDKGKKEEIPSTRNKFLQYGKAKVMREINPKSGKTKIHKVKKGKVRKEKARHWED